MTKVTPRSHPRKAYQAPIQFALLNSDQFERSRTYDYSAEGICYEIPRKLEPETEVCIIMQNYAPGNNGPEAYRSYVARIRWIQPLSKNGNESYAAGAQIVARSHDVLSNEIQLPRFVCDLCGNLELKHRGQQTDSGANLCRQCMKHICNMPSGKIRQCVERFLIGNVI